MAAAAGQANGAGPSGDGAFAAVQDGDPVKRDEPDGPIEKLARVVNNALCGCEKGSFAISPVRIVEAEEKPPEFHARFDAKGKTYIYKINNTEMIDIFQRNYVYHVAEPLDTDAMRQAAKLLTGTHDFKSFEASGSTPRESTVRTIYRMDLLQDGDMLELHVTGDGFLSNMVRILTGTLVDVGRDKLRPQQMTDILAAKDRQTAGHTAPPFGLYLAKVYYEEGELYG